MMNVNVSGSGIVRHVDDLGRIVIPKEVRISLGITENTPLEIMTTSDGGVYLRKPDSTSVSAHDNSESALVRFSDTGGDPIFARLTKPALEFADWLEDNRIDITEGYVEMGDEDFPTF